jgi:hypothetical protein
MPTTTTGAHKHYLPTYNRLGNLAREQPPICGWAVRWVRGVEEWQILWPISRRVVYRTPKMSRAVHWAKTHIQTPEGVQWQPRPPLTEEQRAANTELAALVGL